MTIDREQLEFQKNHLYRDHYRRTIKALLMMLVIALVLICILGYQLWTMPAANYYATTTNGRVIPLQSLRMPVVTNRYLLQWAGLAARACYNLNFVDYQKELQAASSNFTPSAWQSFMAALKAAGSIDSLTENKLVMRAVVNGAPIILGEQIVHGRYTWQVQIPLLVTYTSANEQRKTNYIITMNIARVPVLDAAKSIQITSFIAVRT